MVWEQINSNRYHTRDQNDYCGAASAMMVLAEIGRAYSDLDQDWLFGFAHSHNKKVGWACDPEGLKALLNTCKPTRFAPRFTIYREPSELYASYRILSILQHKGASAIALTQVRKHWLVVFGVDTDIDPTTGPYQLQAFWLHNPLPENNKPHNGQDICDTGNHRPEFEWHNYHEWQQYYLVGNQYDDANGALQFIVVGIEDAPTIPLPGPTPRSSRKEPFIMAGTADERAAPHGDDGELQPRDVEIAVIHGFLASGLKRYELDKNPRTAAFALGAFGNPLFVKRLDAPNGAYALVPSTNSALLLGYGQVSLPDGELQTLYAMQSDRKPFEGDPKKIEKSLVGAEVQLPDGRVFKLAANAFTVDQVLVWMSCRQSGTALLPFWVIRAGTYTFYLRVDGQLFAELTLDDKPG